MNNPGIAFTTISAFSVLLLEQDGSRKFGILFWDELQELLGPIFEPIVAPLFDALRDDAFRSLMLSTTVMVSLILCGMVFVIYELPLVFKWVLGIFDLDAQKSQRPTRSGTPTSSTRRITPSRVAAKRAVEPMKKKKSDRQHTHVYGGVKVEAWASKKREELILDVEVHNQSDRKIEMAVVDVALPFGFDMHTSSFRMVRLGTVDAGDMETARFRLIRTTNEANIDDIEGSIEYMSASYEVSKIELPIPQIRQ